MINFLFLQILLSAGEKYTFYLWLIKTSMLNFFHFWFHLIPNPNRFYYTKWFDLLRFHFSKSFHLSRHTFSTSISPVIIHHSIYEIIQRSMRAKNNQAAIKNGFKQTTVLLLTTVKCWLWNLEMSKPDVTQSHSVCTYFHCILQLRY